MKRAPIIVMTLTGLVLILASALKVHQLMTEGIAAEGFWESWLFYLIQIPLVLGLGIWLCCGLFRKAAWLLGVLALLVFLADTVYKALTKAESCGCFGSVDVDPWITLFVFNIPFLAAMLLFPPKGEKLLPPPWPKPAHFWGTAIPTFLLLPTVVLLLVTNKVEVKKIDLRPNQKTTITAKTDPLPIAPTENKTPTPPDPTPQPDVPDQPDTDTTPEQKTPQPPTDQQPADEQPTQQPPAAPQQTAVPPLDLTDEQTAMVDDLLTKVDIYDQLSEGLAVFVFYHETCPTCREIIPVYDAEINALGENLINMAYIEIPGHDDDNPVPPDTLCYTGTLQPLPEGQKWHIGTPLIVVTMDGRLTKAWQFEVPTFNGLLEAAFE